MPRRSLSSIAAVIGSATFLNAAAAQCSPRWQPGSGVPGIDGLVFDARSWDPDGPGPAPALLVVAGNYSLAGATLAEDVASWNGAAWSAVGGGIGLNVAQEVAALEIHNGELIAAGGFASAAGGTVAVNNIARFDGVSWKPIGGGSPGGGANSFVAALGHYNGELIAGGFFSSAGGVPASRIARWNGTAWAPLGTGVFGAVTALAEFQGELIAAGTFSTAGGVPAGRIARWNGSVWQPLGLGLGQAGSTSMALEVYNGQLYAGGSFFSAGLVAASNIASWDGAAWSAVGAGPQQGTSGGVSALAVHGGELVVGGGFTSAGGVGIGSVARWNGSEWNAVGSGVAAFLPVVSALCSHEGDLIAGGRFVEAGTAAVNNIASWKGPLAGGGTGWTPIGGGFNDGIEALELFDGDVVAGGVFTAFDGVAVNHVARRDGAAWQPLGSGIDGNVFALQTHAGSLIAGGLFSTAGGASAPHLARWDGAAWSALGGTGVGPNATVFALTEHAGDLIAGGEFNDVGGVAAERIARWDGAQWHPLGTGVGGGEFFTTVSALAEYQGDLFAGGDFTIAGGVIAPHIARWDGAAWHAVGGGITGASFPWVHAIAVYHGTLYVGGQFDTAGGLAASNLARWNGTVWNAVGAGTGLDVSALTAHGDDLIVAGSLLAVPSTTIARWNDGGGSGSWLPMGAGLDSLPRALLSHADTLSVGGYFTRSGPTVTTFYAEWECSCYPDCSGDGALTVADFGCFQGKYVLGDPYADCNASGNLTIADFGCFQGKFVLGCP